VDLQTIEVLELDQVRPWHSLRGRRQPYAWLVASTRLRGDSVLRVAKSAEPLALILEQFRFVFGMAMVAVVVLGWAGGTWLTHRALRPLRQLTATARDIVETGRMDARVPSRPAQDELDELVHLFNRVLEKNEVLIRGMRDALDNVAHDLRTPLTRLGGTAEQALSTPDDARVLREALGDVLEESERVQVMLRTLMDISEAETGTMRLDRTRFPAGELVEQVVDLYRIVAEEKGVQLDQRVAPGCQVDGDRVRLQQALANLVDNALKYTPPGGRVEVRAEAAGARVLLTVADTGMGITEEDKPRIWQRLYRGDKSRSEKGLGLGLSLVKAIVQAHGGQVEVVSRVGHGSEFRVCV
jgi:signal transduction histidine kinase